MTDNLPELFQLFPNEWKLFIEKDLNEYNISQFLKLSDFLNNEYKIKPNRIYPERSFIFSTFNSSPGKIKCVILGQDPYHGKGEANGLAFSVNKNIKIPPSLKNIFKELNDDLNIPFPSHGDLSSWVNEGVLLLNSVLTVEEKTPASHANKGWETFTNLIIKCISNYTNNIVFMLWGKTANAKTCFIDSEKHLIISSTHPSPFSCFGSDISTTPSFFKSKPFSGANDFLKERGIEEINWRIT